MNKSKRKMAIITALCLFNIANANPIIDNDKIMDKAVSDFQTTYEQIGIQGNIVEIQQCYANPKQDKLYCFYYDYLARIIDTRVTAELNMPNDPFFSDDTFGERAFTHLYAPRRADFNESNEHLLKSYQKLSEKFYKKISSGSPNYDDN